MRSARLLIYNIYGTPGVLVYRKGPLEFKYPGEIGKSDRFPPPPPLHTLLVPSFSSPPEDGSKMPPACILLLFLPSIFVNAHVTSGLIKKPSKIRKNLAATHAPFQIQQKSVRNGEKNKARDCSGLCCQLGVIPKAPGVGIRIGSASRVISYTA